MATKKKTTLKKTAPATYKGRSTKPGGGGAFQKMKDALMAEGKSAESAAAITAAEGRKKYGKQEFQQMAEAGRKRAARKRKLASR